MTNPEPPLLEVPEHLAPRQRPGPIATLTSAALLGFVVLVLILGAVRGVTALWPERGSRVVWDGPEYFAPPDPNPIRVTEFDGWEHCQWQTIRFMVVPAAEVPGSAPLGDRGHNYQVTYVRTSAHILPRTQGDFEPIATLPADAFRTPYTDGARELWFSPSEATLGAYIVERDNVERWPRFDGGCD